MAIIHIFGRLTEDPVSRQLPSGGTVTDFSIADNHGKDKEGKEKVDFFRCSAFGKQAEMIQASCKRGHRLNVSGRFASRVFKNNQGADQTSLEVSVAAFDFVEPRSDTQTQSAPQTSAPAQQQQTPRPVQPQTYQDPRTGIWYQAVNGQWVPMQPQPQPRPVLVPPTQQYAPQPAPPMGAPAPYPVQYAGPPLAPGEAPF